MPVFSILFCLQMVAAEFLWASDFIQTLESPSRYAREVMDAAERDGIRPERVASEHLPITMWSEVLKAQASVISR